MTGTDNNYLLSYAPTPSIQANTTHTAAPLWRKRKEQALCQLHAEKTLTIYCNVDHYRSSATNLCDQDLLWSMMIYTTIQSYAVLSKELQNHSNRKLVLRFLAPPSCLEWTTKAGVDPRVCDCPQRRWLANVCCGHFLVPKVTIYSVLFEFSSTAL